MGTIFVAYGGPPGQRTTVLEFAAERAAASGDGLLVYHAREVADEPARDVEAEVRATVDRVDPGVPVEVDLNAETDDTEAAAVSKQKRLTDAVLEGDREFEYVVMGEVEHGRI
jgi:alkanesulfonate monooxygenase SsuD/methylene tetrahydromethanopterin reductase-like flavin-dependent oxidoreductase (luciferase family)